MRDDAHSSGSSGLETVKEGPELSSTQRVRNWATNHTDGGVTDGTIRATGTTPIYWWRCASRRSGGERTLLVGNAPGREFHVTDLCECVLKLELKT